jgi:MFS family permease
MQNVLGYSPLRAGLAFLPQTLAIIVGAQLAARLVTRVGARAMLTVSPLITLAGLAWLSNLPAHGAYWQTLFGPSVLVTFGMGLAFTPIAVAATSGVPREQSGLASGLVNTMRMVGGALGLAVLATVATDRSTALLHGRSLSAGLARAGHALPAPLAHALTSGYGRAFLISAAVAAVASAAALSLPRAAVGPARPFQEGRLEQRVAVDASEPARPA